MFAQRSTFKPNSWYFHHLQIFQALAYCFRCEWKKLFSRNKSDDNDDEWWRISFHLSSGSPEDSHLGEFFSEFSIPTHARCFFCFLRFCISILVSSLLTNSLSTKLSFQVSIQTKLQVKRDERKTVCKEQRRKSKNKCKITSCLVCFGKELGQVYHASLECFSVPLTPSCSSLAGWLAYKEKYKTY